MPYPNNPLNDEHAAALTNVQQSALETKQLLDDLRSVGMPLEELEVQNAKHLGTSKALKSKFFPELD